MSKSLKAGNKERCLRQVWDRESVTRMTMIGERDAF